MEQKIRVAGYVKLAKLWEKRAHLAIPYHNQYYKNKFDGTDYELVDVYIDITGNKQIYKRPEMVRLIRDCIDGKVDCIYTQTRAYIAANMKEFCYLIYRLFELGKKIYILTEDDDYNYNIDTITNLDGQREALHVMAAKYIALNPDDYCEWAQEVDRAMREL